MTEEEFKALVEKVGLEAAKVIKAEAEKLEAALKAEHANVMKGVATKEEIEAFKADVLKSNNDLIEKLKVQGIKMAELENAAKGNTDNTLEVFKNQLDEQKPELDRIKLNKAGSVAFTLKAAGVTGTVGIGGNAASIVEQGSAAALLRLGDGPVYTIQRGLPFILNFVSVGNTTAAALIWFDEIPKAGDFAVTAEGALKPLVQYLFERRTASYRKAAGYSVITEEFDQDFPRLVSTIKQLMQIDVRNVMTDLILTDMIANASPYAYNGLDGQIDNADDYAAIGAAIAQLQALYYTPNVLVLNPADAWRMKLQKGVDGHYIMPPFQWDGKTYEFGTVVVDPRVAVGNFFIGDGSVYHVDLKGDIIVRIGYNGDDFIRNQYTIVVEQYFYNYISTAKKPGFIYANFNTIKADIELV